MGVAGKNGVRNHSVKECQEILDVYFRHGHREIDTARTYAEGTTEEVSRLLPTEFRCTNIKVILCSNITVFVATGLEGKHLGYEVR